MPINTLSLAKVDRAYVVASKDVLSWRDCLKMVWVDAPRFLAQVVNLKAIRDRTYEVLIGHHVRDKVLPEARDFAVPVIRGTLPDPTAIRIDGEPAKQPLEKRGGIQRNSHLQAIPTADRRKEPLSDGYGLV